MHKFILLIGLIAQPTLAQRQVQDTTLTRTVVVEQEYTPEITDAAKVNVLPRVEPPAAVKSVVEYDTSLQPATDVPAGILPVYAGVTDEPRAKRGYARLGYGTHGNVDAYGAYLLPLSDKDKVRLDVGFDGWNTKLNRYRFPGASNESQLSTANRWTSKFYRTRAGAEYTHSFRRMELGAQAGFDFTELNYPPYNVGRNDKHVATRWGVNLRTTDDRRLKYALGVDYKTFVRDFLDTKNVSEQIVTLKGGFSYSLNTESRFGADFDFSNYRYGKLSEYNYFLLHGKPYYERVTDDWQLHLGASVDLMSKFEQRVKLAPDVKVQYTLADGYLVYAQATGGVMANDFRRITAESLYGTRAKEAGRMTTTHETVNATLGTRMTPLDGLWFHLYGGYQKRKGDIVNSWESYHWTMLDFSGSSLTLYDYANGVLPLLRFQGEAYRMKQISTRNTYVGLDVRYAYKDLFAFTAETLWRNWKKGTGLAADVHVFKPVFEADFRMEVRPLATLLLEPGYRHAGYKRVWQSGAGSFRRNSVQDLYLRASYELKPNLRLYARVHNLLGKQYEQHPYVYAQKRSLLLGASILF